MNNWFVLGVFGGCPRKAATAGLMAVVIVAGGFGLPGHSASANTLELVLPNVAYQADITIQAGRISFSGKIHYAIDRERREIGFARSKRTRKPMIIRRDKQVIWVLNPGSETFFATPMPKLGGTAGPGFAGRKLVEQTKLGSEVLDNIATTKYRLVFAKQNDVQISGTAWITADNILMRLHGISAVKDETAPIIFSLSNLKIGPQDAKLFDVPAGFKPVRPLTSGAVRPKRAVRPGLKPAK